MNRTESYVGTYDYQSAASMLELQKIRDTVKAINKLAAKTDKYAAQRQTLCSLTRHETPEIIKKSPRYYLKCQGRFGKSNQNLHKYTYNLRNGSTYTSYRICRLEDATHVDAYVYQR